MHNVLSDKATSVRVEFKVGSEYLVPDDGTVTYTLRDNDGSEIAGYVDQPLVPETGTTSVVVSIPGSVNALPNGAKFGYRAILVSYESNGVTYHNTVRYRVHPYLNFHAGPDNVRSYLGVHSSELPDNDIDLVSAFYHLQLEATDIDLASKFSSGTVEAFTANQALVYMAALEVIPSFQLRIAQRQTSDGSSLSRLENLDFKAMEEKARQDLAGALSNIKDETQVGGPLMVVTNDTDLFSGA